MELTDQMLGGLLAGSIIGGIIGTIALLGIAIYVLLIIAEWRIFTKAGEKGWKSLIPIYNGYIMFKLFWNTSWFWITFAVGIVGSILENSLQEGSTAAIIISFASAIFSLYISIKMCNRLAKSFGKGTGFTIGLIFLPNIFQLILAFGSAQYTKLED